MSQRISVLKMAIAAWLAAFFWISPLSAQDMFYKGKTIRLIVAFSAGGGFDTYSRAIARHLAKHIPGNPVIIVDNMTGAGGFIQANYMYLQAKPDGLTIGSNIGGLFLQQIFGAKGIEFDGRKFEYLGGPAVDNPVCALTKASGITSIEKWYAAKEPVKLGGVGPGGTASDVARIVQAALNLPIKVVEPYKGTADIKLAAEEGELAGGCWAWESIKTMWRKGLETGDVAVMVLAMPKKHSDLPNVPRLCQRRGRSPLAQVRHPRHCYHYPPLFFVSRNAERSRAALAQGFLRDFERSGVLGRGKKI